MTHHTDAERAEFEALGISKGWNMTAIMLTSMPPKFSSYVDPATQRAFESWQAARRAPVVKVPQFSRIAQKKLDYLLEAGEAITGYAIENKDGRRGAIDCHGFVYWWQDAAAPQPPEAQASVSNGTFAAPVQLPEPAGWIDDGGMVFWNDGRKPNDGEIIYTEHQVRQLLANHGIQEQST